MYCDRCDRAVVAMPGALAEKTWRCPHCLGPAHEGDEPAPTRRARLTAASWAVHLFAGLGFLVALAQGGPHAWLTAISVAGGFLLVVVAARQLEARFEGKPALIVPTGDWLDDARASYGRGTDISTLAVRYGVEPGWLEQRLTEGSRATAP